MTASRKQKLIIFKLLDKIRSFVRHVKIKLIGFEEADQR